MAAAFLCAASWIAARAQQGESAPASHTHPVMATRFFTGADGQTHFDQVPITLEGVPAEPVEESAALKMSDAYVVRAAPGMFEPWHNADRKRYIVVLSGEAEITTTGGEKARIVPGQIYIAEDLAGKGHTFRVIGNEDWVALFVNFAQ